MCVLCRGTSFLNIIFNFDFIIAFAFITMNVYCINILLHRKSTSTSFQIRTNFPICSNNTSYIICYILYGKQNNINVIIINFINIIIIYNEPVKSQSGNIEIL